MPRKYIRKLGARAYRNYTQETLNHALEQLKTKQISFRNASERYGIPLSTLILEMKKGKNQDAATESVQPVQNRTSFTTEEENMLVAHIVSLSIMGFPITLVDLRNIAASYLIRIGKKVRKFKGGVFPGKDWAYSFLQRNKNTLSSRLVKNITTKRAAVGPEEIQKYFNNLKEELDGIPPSNIWNYDETNLVDDPGVKVVLVKRGTKYPERIRNASKACTTLMCCGSADGTMAPIYINYKAECIYDEWQRGGPPKARYNRTKSGWMDLKTFEDWFEGTMLPLLKKLEGKKVLIGDNLSSHLSYQVITKCKENNITFICLPPNSSHLTQPLDVAVFRSMKGLWREVLTTWKQTESGKRCPTVPKMIFPKLVNQLVERMNTTIEKNLKSGFRACGIFPLEPENVLRKLSNSQLQAETHNLKEHLSVSFIEHLEQTRKDTLGVPKKRGKKINVPPGKGITPDDFPQEDETPSTSTPSTSALQGTTQNSTGREVKKGRRTRDNESDTESSNSSISLADTEDEVPNVEELCGTSFDEEDESNPLVEENATSNTSESEVIGEYVVVKYEESNYPGRILLIEGDEIKITCMKKCGKYWKWPTPSDETWYQKNQIVRKIPVPKQISRREIFLVDMKP